MKIFVINEGTCTRVKLYGMDVIKLFEINFMSISFNNSSLVKELKFLEASRYASISNEIYNGYKALDQYLKEISKFQSVQTLRTLN